MKDDNGLILGVPIDYFASEQGRNLEIDADLADAAETANEETETPDVVRDEGPDQWGDVTGVSETLGEGDDDVALD